MKKIFSLLMLPAVIVLMMSCSCEDEIVPEVGFPQGSTDYFSESINFDNRAGEKSISFVSNVPWTISVDDTRNGDVWCTVSPTQGEAGTANIKIRVEENSTYDDRNAVLRLSYGDTYKNIFVNQKQLDAITLTVDRFEVPAEGGTVNVEVKANIDYNVIIDEECKNWIHQKSSSPTRALSTTFFQFQIDPTDEYEQREGKIFIKSGDKSETVSIYQVGDEILSLTKKEFNLDNSEQDVKIEINSNFEYDVEMPDVDWISEIRTRGMSTHTLYLHVAENTTYDDRSAKIHVYDKNSDVSEEIIINQSQTNAILFDKDEYVFDENGGEFTLNVNSNVDYRIDISDDWITEVPATRSLTTRSYTFKVAPLAEDINREAKITFSDSDKGLEKAIIVKQYCSMYFEDNTYELMENSSKLLHLVNQTGQPVIFSSSDESVATVDDQGMITALSRGRATITATTVDGKHKCVCEVKVVNITDYISARNTGGSVVVVNGIIRSGSQLMWSFMNNSNENVFLKSLQLIGGDGYEGNMMDVNATVKAKSSVAYSTTIGLLGIKAPVTCRFRFEYNDKEYYVDAVYD